MFFEYLNVTTLFLDLDGTLLDLAFDHKFFREVLPAAFSREHGVTRPVATRIVNARLAEIEGTLKWYSLDHLEELFKLDLTELTHRLVHGVRWHHGAEHFVQTARERYRHLVLVTNAHPRVLRIKFQNISLGHYFDAIVSSHQVGLPKEALGFWHRLQAVEWHDPQRTLLIDDNPAVLRSAQRAGIKVIGITRPDSTQPARCFQDGIVGVENIAELTPFLGQEGL